MSVGFYLAFVKKYCANCSAGGWSDKSDVFAYGVILLGLMTKNVDEGVRNGKLSNKGQ